MKEDFRYADFEFAVINGERLMSAPDEFLEYLRDCGYTDSIEMEEMMDVLDDWLEE